jgi:SAM-dependent methyltransferase
VTRQHAPATARNREPIREVLVQHLPDRGVVLELAAGTGEHAVYLAQRFPALAWQPSDRDPSALASIAAWREEAALDNLLAPLRIDVTEPAWPIEAAAAITCINMVHISPWAAALGMFAGAARLLATGGLLYLYGPYRFDGAFTAPSNDEFDRSLRARDPQWGVRDIRELEAAATSFSLCEIVAMPANNHSVIFRRR